MSISIVGPEGRPCGRDMTSPIEAAANKHIDERSTASLQNLYRLMLSGKLLVPVFASLSKDASGRTDVPARCIRLPNGEGCLPVFTSVGRLLEWRKEGSEYVEMPGRTLFEMARAMTEIDCIYVNYSDRPGTPKGEITRAEFESLAQGRLPGSVS